MPSARDIIRRSPHRMVGAVTLPRLSNHPIAWESRLELDAILILAACKDVNSITSQPFKLQYADSANNQRTYFPDLLVGTETGEFVVEIKPLAKLLEPENLDRFACIRTHFNAQEIRFEVLTEEELWIEPRRSNASVLKRYTAHAFNQSKVTAGLSIVTESPRITIREVGKKSPELTLSDVFALLAGHHLAFDWGSALSLDTALSIPDQPFGLLRHEQLFTSVRTDRLLSPVALVRRQEARYRLEAAQTRRRATRCAPAFGFV